MTRDKCYCLPATYKCQKTCVKTGFWTQARIEREPFNGSYNVFQWIAEREAQELDNARILDIGCGPASKLRKFFPTASVTGIDMPEALEFARINNPGGTFLACDLDDMARVEEVSSALGKFRFIICVDVIEHVLFPENILALVRKNLAREGIAYIATLERDLSRGWEAVLSGSPKKEHVREWNQEEFCRFVRSAGFIIHEVKITEQAVKPTDRERPFRVQTLRCSFNQANADKPGV